MKKICYCIITILMISCIMSVSIVNAADEYSFLLSYTGEVVVGESKDANVILKGTNATGYGKVRIKVEIDGPATPKIIATDSSGNQIDIAKEGYWGPPTGFAVGGTFENITPIKATFTVAGTYKIKLSLINLEAGDAVITTTTETIEVLEDKANIVNEVNEVGNNTIEKLPQTGTSITEYLLYTAIIASIIGFGYYEIRKARI